MAERGPTIVIYKADIGPTCPPGDVCGGGADKGPTKGRRQKRSKNSFHVQVYRGTCLPLVLFIYTPTRKPSHRHSADMVAVADLL